MAEMSPGLANCFCGQPRLKPPVNPSAGQFAGFAGAAGGWAKPTEPVHTTAANAAPIPNAFSFIIGCSPLIAAWKDVIIYPCCFRLSPRSPDWRVVGQVVNLRRIVNPPDA